MNIILLIILIVTPFIIMDRIESMKLNKLHRAILDDRKLKVWRYKTPLMSRSQAIS